MIQISFMFYFFFDTYYRGSLIEDFVIKKLGSSKLNGKTNRKI